MSKNSKTTGMKPSRTIQGRENQLINRAIDLAEQQLIDGTASAQVITHFLKLGSTKERLEKEILAKQAELITAKTEGIKSQQNSEALYSEAIKAFGIYSGKDPEEPIDESYTDVY